MWQFFEFAGTPDVRRSAARLAIVPGDARLPAVRHPEHGRSSGLRSVRICARGIAALPVQKGLKQTVLGMSPGQDNPALAPAPPAAQPPAPPMGRFGGTMIGMQSPFAAPAPRPAAVPPAPTPGLKQTMMGCAAAPPGLAQQGHAAAPRPPAATRAIDNASDQNPALGSTLVYDPPSKVQLRRRGRPGGRICEIQLCNVPLRKCRRCSAWHVRGLPPLRPGEPTPQPASQPPTTRPRAPVAAMQPRSAPQSRDANWS